MEILVIQPGGAYLAALYFGTLPFVILLVVWLIRRTRAETGLWLGKRFGNMPLGVLLLVYYGIVWHWLFYNQFYSVRGHSKTSWELEYLMPRRSEIIRASDIVSISTDNIISISGGMTTTRLVITMRDGQRLRSAQIARYHADDDIDALRAAAQQRAPSDAGRPYR